MAKNTVYMYVFDTLSDWEWGYVTAELKTGRFFKKGVSPCDVKTFGLKKKPVITMGGITITPDLSIEEIETGNICLLLLPGGETWLEEQHAPVVEKAKEYLASGIPVAAICGATMALAAAGVLDTFRHTSNDLQYLKNACPSYKGENNYRFEGAVTDGDLITAGGMAPLEFTREILKKLAVFSVETLECWYNVFKVQEPQCFYKLIKSLE